MQDDRAAKPEDHPKTSEAELRRVIQEGDKELERGESVSLDTVMRDFDEALLRMRHADRAKRAS